MLGEVGMKRPSEKTNPVGNEEESHNRVSNDVDLVALFNMLTDYEDREMLEIYRKHIKRDKMWTSHPQHSEKDDEMYKIYKQYEEEKANKRWSKKQKNTYDQPTSPQQRGRETPNLFTTSNIENKPRNSQLTQPLDPEILATKIAEHANVVNLQEVIQLEFKNGACEIVLNQNSEQPFTIEDVIAVLHLRMQIYGLGQDTVIVQPQPDRISLFINSEFFDGAFDKRLDDLPIIVYNLLDPVDPADCKELAKQILIEHNVPSSAPFKR